MESAMDAKTATVATTERKRYFATPRIIDGLFNQLSHADKDLAMEVKALFHVRNGILHDDGSMGEIRVTPGQLNHLLAWLILEVRKGI